MSVPVAEIDTRTRILAAAGPVFAKHGFERATVREICASAGVNIAAVGYHFGDKLGLYRELIQQIRDLRERQFPTPDNAHRPPEETLARIVRTMLSRILAADPSGWESQLFMREMQDPTPVFESIVREFFEPLFSRLSDVLGQLAGPETPHHVVQKLTLSVVGQCVYYKFGAGVIEILIPEKTRQQHFDIDSLVHHITAFSLAAAKTLAAAKSLSEHPQICPHE